MGRQVPIPMNIETKATILLAAFLVAAAVAYLAILP
jgi:hypothetical protein